MNIWNEERVKISMPELIKGIQIRINAGWNLNWIITDKINYHWEDITNDPMILIKLENLNPSTCSLGWFNPNTKQTIYEAFDVI